MIGELDRYLDTAQHDMNSRLTRVDWYFQNTLRRLHRRLNTLIDHNIEGLPHWMVRNDDGIIIYPGTPHDPAVALQETGALVRTQYAITPEPKENKRAISGKEYRTFAEDRIAFLQNYRKGVR